jgi:NCAIR mutase (PurE)-related protein
MTHPILASPGKNEYIFGAFMTKQELTELLRKYKKGSMSEEAAAAKIRGLQFASLGFATVDHHRPLRQGFPEVILCQGKTPTQTAAIAEQITRHGGPLLATRATRQHFAAIKRKVRGAKFHELARVVTANEPKSPDTRRGIILIVSAGTADLPVAEEAAITASIMGNRVEKLYDVGVAGIHRLLSQSPKLHAANVIIVVAGMEGALPSVVGGLVDVPVIAVPTSVGYGASFQGVAALLGMLNSCASGVTVVNIDNGFGAAFAASLMNKKNSRDRG